MLEDLIMEEVEFLSNCLFWAGYQWVKYGGELKFEKSKTWFGFHCYWISPYGERYDFTLKRKKKQPWWYIPFIFKGVVKKRQRLNTEKGD
jgi:hypothetical protein